MNSKEVRSNNKACDKKVSRPIYRHFTGIKFFTCPSNYYRDSYAHWFDILRHFQEGRMTFDMDTPNKVFECLHFVETLQANYKSERLKEIGNG